MIFQDLETNQKMSIINFLTTIALCDNPVDEKESEMISTIGNLCGVVVNDCVSYFKNSGGHLQLTDDLKSLSHSQKELLVVTSWELIICDGKPNESELSVAFALFEKISITEDEFFDIIDKKDAIMKYFNFN